MKTRFQLLVAFFAIVLTSCSSPKKEAGLIVEEELQQEIPEAFKNECQYSYVHDSTKVNWTAYKYESKAGVGGSFGKVEVFTLADKGTFTEVLNGLEFRISKKSSTSANADRDAKILKQFWANLIGGDVITGEIKEVQGTQEKGEVRIKLSLNNLEQFVNGVYTMHNGKISLDAEIDLEDFDGLAAIAALNKVCVDLHREAPGEKSVLWPTVDVHVEGFLLRDCAE